MSLAPVGISVLQSELANLVDDPTIFLVRSIGGFVADITVRERHRDELVITEIPVEQGAAITDHAYKRPSTVVIDVGYSNSSPQANSSPSYVQDTYGQFLTLQASREPFDIITGKRVYQNMLMGVISTVTDEKNEFVAFLTCECREIILVNTQTVQVPPASAQKQPQITQPSIDRGAVQLQPAPNFNSTAPTP